MPRDGLIETTADLKGKKIGLNKGSNVRYLLMRALDKAGLKYTDVELIFLPRADGRAGFDCRRRCADGSTALRHDANAAAMANRGTAGSSGHAGRTQFTRRQRLAGILREHRLTRRERSDGCRRLGRRNDLTIADRGRRNRRPSRRHRLPGGRGPHGDEQPTDLGLLDPGVHRAAAAL